MTSPTASAAVMMMICALGGCTQTGASPGQPPSDGPLQFPKGYAAMLAGSPKAMFSTFDACLDGESATVTVNEVTYADLTGAEQVEVRVGWPTPRNPNRIGAGPSPVPDLFGPVAGSTGLARACDQPPAGVEFAVVFPPAVDRDVVADGFTVTYTIGSRTYTEAVDVRLGVCALRPTGGTSAECG